MDPELTTFFINEVTVSPYCGHITWVISTAVITNKPLKHPFGGFQSNMLFFAS